MTRKKPTQIASVSRARPFWNRAAKPARPLTAATLTLDEIVEMCDELMAAHGDLLPKLDGKKSLVQGCGKSFGKVDAGELRRRWGEGRRADPGRR